MNISGVLVHVSPARITPVTEQLHAIPGVEVHASSPEGKLVVTVEDDSVGGLADKVMHLQNVNGVLSVAMVYHHSEDDSCVNDINDFPAEAPGCACDSTSLQEASS